MGELVVGARDPFLAHSGLAAQHHRDSGRLNPAHEVEHEVQRLETFAVVEDHLAVGLPHDMRVLRIDGRGLAVEHDLALDQVIHRR